MRVRLYLGVIGCDGVIGIERFIEMPSAPVPGMLFCGITRESSDIWEWPVQSVMWNVEEQCYDVHLENDEEQSGDETAKQKVEIDWGSDWIVK